MNEPEEWKWPHKECPFCGCNQCGILVVEDNLKLNEDRCFIFCPMCNAHGPEKKQVRDCEIAWENRWNEVKEQEQSNGH
jgi:hypothetical protein